MSDTNPPQKPTRKPRKSTVSKATKKDAGTNATTDPRPKRQASPSRAKRGTVSEPASKKATPGHSPPAQDGDIGDASSAAPQDLIRAPMPVRWRDLDAFNHVNNSKYLSYLEEARLHWMIGLPGKGMDDHVAPVVAAAQLNYRRPIAWPAQVVVELFVERLGTTSLSAGHRIIDAENPNVLYCDGHVVMVWIDRDSGAAAALPVAVREACSGS